MRVLVTGALGFAGRWLLKELRTKGDLDILGIGVELRVLVGQGPGFRLVSPFHHQVDHEEAAKWRIGFDIYGFLIVNRCLFEISLVLGDLTADQVIPVGQHRA